MNHRNDGYLIVIILLITFIVSFLIGIPLRKQLIKLNNIYNASEL
jgi:preprotein translocase subunit YajC